MINFYYFIIRKSFEVLKKEPTILIPALILHLGISFIIYFGVDLDSLSQQSFTIQMVIGWIMPLIIIEPIAIFWAWITIRRIRMDFKTVLNQYFYGIGGILLISSLYKPIDLYILSLLKETVILENSSELSIMSQIGGQLLFIWGVTIIFRLIFFYFKFDYLTSLNAKPNILTSIKTSFKLFIKFKWVTIGSIIFWQIFFLSVSFIILIFTGLFPKELYRNFLAILVACESVFSMIFFLNIYLRVKPAINLNDN